MSGSIQLSLSQQFDKVTGRLLNGGKVYFYQAGSTTTLQNAFRDAGLITPYPNPITLESDGRVPYLWFADGTIRTVVMDVNGVTQFEQDNMQVYGASGGGGGGVDTTDVNALFNTGDIKWRADHNPLLGWVRANGKTIGPVGSTGTEMQSADCHALFLQLWNNFPDAVCPVLPARGASAAADWSDGHKVITLLDLRGRALHGIDGMGNSNTGRLSGALFLRGDPFTDFAWGGEPIHQLSMPEMPQHNHGGATDPFNFSHGHQYTSPNAPISGFQGGGGGTAVVNRNVGDTTGGTDVDLSNVTIGFSTDYRGSNGAHNNMHPFALGTYYIRL